MVSHHVLSGIDGVMKQRQFFLRRAGISILWSIVLFGIMALCCVVFITLTAEPPSATAAPFDVALSPSEQQAAFGIGARVAYAVASMQESHVFVGLLVLSVMVSVFGAVVQVLPGTDTESLEEHFREDETVSYLALAPNCPNCGTVLAGRYCSNCGQERTAAGELTMRSFFVNVLPDILNLDSKFFTTLSILLRKPGFLTREYLRGRRVRYSAPVQLYALVTAAFFFVSANLDFDIDKLIGQVPALEARIQQKATNEGLAAEVIKLKLNETLENYIPFYTFFMMVAFAGLLKMVYPYWQYVEHIVFSLHIMSASLLMWMLMILLGLVFPVAERYEGFIIVPALVYLLAALREAHRSSPLWKWLPAALGFVLLFTLYTAVSLAIGMFF
jgi:hypothetical protein